jgi:hypothetical protein
MISTDYNDCPHCLTITGEGEYDYENTGCDQCGHTGSRTLTPRDLALFESSREWMEDRIDRVFSLWQQRIEESKLSWTAEKTSFDSNYAYVEAKSYRGCSEYDYRDFKMPVKYLLAANPVEFIDAEVAERNAARIVAEALKREDQIRQRQLNEQAEEQRRALALEAQEQHDYEEWQRLQLKFSKPEKK